MGCLAIITTHPCPDDFQHLLVMDLIVPLSRTQALGEEGDLMPFSAIWDRIVLVDVLEESTSV